MTVHYPDSKYYTEIETFLKDISVGDYYYHFKYSPEDSFEVNAYRIVGFATDTATEPEQLLVLYAPMYSKDNVSYFPKSTCASRPIHDFFKIMDRPPYNGPRFIKITDEEIINKLNGLVPTLPVQ